MAISPAASGYSPRLAAGCLAVCWRTSRPAPPSQSTSPTVLRRRRSSRRGSDHSLPTVCMCPRGPPILHRSYATRGPANPPSSGSRSCMDPLHLLYDEPLVALGGARGLIARMDDQDVTCGNDAQIATGHLSSYQKFSYGDFTWVAQIGHAPDGTRTPSNVFSCLAIFVHGGLPHNEIAWCGSERLRWRPRLGVSALFRPGARPHTISCLSRAGASLRATVAKCTCRTGTTTGCIAQCARSTSTYPQAFTATSCVGGPRGSTLLLMIHLYIRLEGKQVR